MLKIILKVLNKLGILNKLQLVFNKNIEGKTFKILLKGDEGHSNLFLSEPWMINVLKLTLSIENKLFVDVGVNIGQTLLKVKSISDEVNYIGFEPNSTCVTYVEKLISINRMKNVKIIPTGISNFTGLGSLVFYDHSLVDPSASIVNNFRTNNQVVYEKFVPIIELKYIEPYVSFDNMSVLKIDVEGAELEVIKEMSGLISKNNPIILMEILPAYHAENQIRIDRQNEIQNILKNLNYTFFRILKENSQLKNIVRIDEIGIHSDISLSDYIIVPKSKITSFKNKVDEFLK
jgi:FkbM family methyltransferase